MLYYEVKTRLDGMAKRQLIIFLYKISVESWKTKAELDLKRLFLKADTDCNASVLMIAEPGPCVMCPVLGMMITTSHQDSTFVWTGYCAGPRNVSISQCWC